MERRIAASDFKARCLRLLDEVGTEGRAYIVTKRGRDVAKLVPIGAPGRSLRGAWKGRVVGDIVHCDWTEEFESTR
jgi:prevent-host-death family protein